MRIKTLSQVRAEVLSGNPFDINFCAYDETRRTGGERKQYIACKLVATPKAKGKCDTAVAIKERVDSKNPQHFLHGTFNVSLIKEGVPVIRKIHWLLIEEFNGFQVVL